MKTYMWKTCLAVLFCISIMLSGCTLQRDADQAPTPSPDSPSTALAVEEPSISFAQEIALEATDIGEGWVMDAEVSDLNASYYFDISEDGKALIGTHRTTKTPVVDPATVESITMRAYSNSKLNLVLFHVVVVFHENVQAEEISFRLIPDDIEEEGLPREWITKDEERYTAREASIGDESVFVTMWLDENRPLMNNLEFRKGRVWGVIISMGRWELVNNSPPLDEDQMEELGRQLEAQIP